MTPSTGSAAEGGRSLSPDNPGGALQTSGAEAALLGFAVFLATLWDFRVSDLRVFDGAALAILIALIAHALWRKRNPCPASGVLILAATIGAYAAYGYLVFHHKSSLALIAGCLILLGLSPLRSALRSATRWYPAIAWVHIAAFAIQVASYLLFHKVFDYYALYGAPARLFLNPHAQQRFAGLYLEPNNYCLTLFMVLVVCALFQRSRILAVVGATTMVISQSGWGIGAAVLLILLHELRPKATLRVATAMLLDLALVVAISGTYLWSTRLEGQAYPSIVERAAGWYHDPSLYERFIVKGAANHPQALSSPLELTRPAIVLTPAPKPAIDIPKYVAVIFGKGFTTSHFLGTLPANGFALLGISFGILGSLLLLLGSAIALRPLSGYQRLIAALGFAVTMSTYPLFTYLIFWLWLDTLLIPLPRASEAAGKAAL